MKLTTKEISYLAMAFTDRTPISLFSNINDTPDGSEYQSLTDKGIIKGGEYNPEALEILFQIAKPERCTRLIIQTDFFIIEKYTYKDGDKLLLAENNHGEIEFKKIDSLKDVISSLSEIFGMSTIKTADISISLKSDEMLVLLAMIDIYRKNALLAYAGQRTFKAAVSVQDIADALKSGIQNSIAQIIVRDYHYAAPAADSIEEILAALIEKKCVSFDDGYKLDKNYELLASNFLIPESTILLETFNISETGKLASSGGLYLTAGIHDIISLMFNEDIIQLVSLSGWQMLAIFEDLMKCPDI
jgi:hypothetical protein